VTTVEHQTSSPLETSALGAAIAALVRPAGTIYLHGDLGAGKTLLAKAIFAAFGIAPERVTSPTFQIVNRYSTGPPALYHVDLYRIAGCAELDGIGLDEILDSDGVVVIEWAERIPTDWGKPDVRVHIEDLGDDRRRIVIESHPA